MSRVQLSAVVPVLDEADNLARAARRAVRRAGFHRAGHGDRLRRRRVDGRVDRRSSRASPRSRRARVKVVVLRRNFGKSGALAAGFAQARGDRIVTLDADGQDDPVRDPGPAGRDGRRGAGPRRRLAPASRRPRGQALDVAHLQPRDAAADRAGAARLQHRLQAPHARGRRGAAALRRVPPLRAGAGPRPGVPVRRGRGRAPRPPRAAPRSTSRCCASPRRCWTC